MHHVLKDEIGTPVRTQDSKNRRPQEQMPRFEILRSCHGQVFDDGMHPAVQKHGDINIDVFETYESETGDHDYDDSAALAPLHDDSDGDRCRVGRGITRQYDDMRSIYHMMIPDDSYFEEETVQNLFISLIEVEHLQFALLGVEKQVELMESIVIKVVQPGEIIYDINELSSEFFIVLGSSTNTDSGSSSSNSSSSSSNSSSSSSNGPRQEQPKVEIIPSNLSDDAAVKIDETQMYLGDEHRNVNTCNDNGNSANNRVKLLIYEDQVFGHERFLFNKVGSERRQYTAKALSTTKVACIYPDDFWKWAHFRHSLINDQRSKLEDKDRRLQEQYRKNVNGIEKHLQQLECDFQLEMEYLEKKAFEADELMGDVEFDGAYRKDIERMRLIKERENAKIRRLEDMLVSMYFSPLDSRSAADLKQKRLSEEVMMVKQVEQEEQRRLLLAEEVARVRTWQYVRERYRFMCT